MEVVTLSQARLWPVCLKEISSHHLLRYEFANSLVYGRVLDAACGTGYGSWTMFSKGANVLGVDANKKALLWAREFWPGPVYIPGRIENKPWHPLSRFDWVVSLETIEHVEDAPAILKVFRSVSNGGFVFSVPNEEHYPFKAEDFKDDDSPHFRHYTPEQFDAVLQEAGFKVIERFCQKSKAKPEVVQGTDGKFLIYVCS